jgi:hypothetical protein
MKLKTQIKNLESLKKACQENEIDFIEERGGTRILLKDLHVGGPTYSRSAHVCKQDGYYTLEGDTDPHYSSLAARLGRDYGKLLQSYAKHEVLNNVQLAGGVLTEQKLKADGSLVLRVSL